MSKKVFGLPAIVMVLSSVFFSVSSCANDDSENPAVALELPEKDTINPVEEKKMPELKINYRIDSLNSAGAVDTFQMRFGEEEKRFISALNRVDVHRVNKGDVLVIPDTITGDIMDYSPFPERLELFSSIPKTVVISRRIQAFALYEGDSLIRWGPVSSGKETTPTPAGLHYGNYKAKNKVSTVNNSWLMPYYFNFMNFEGVGVHQFTMPGYPASHACVRLRKEDAVAIYNWAEQWELTEDEQSIIKNGTPFMVLGDYEFENPVPWIELAENEHANELTEEEMKILEDYVRQYMKDPRNFEQEENGEPEDGKLHAPPDELETSS